VIEIHPVLLVAVHVQPACAVTLTLPVPLAALNVWLPGLIE
jgi:hypothetical protein